MPLREDLVAAQRHPALPARGRRRRAGRRAVAGAGRAWSGRCCSTTSSPRRSHTSPSPSTRTCWRSSSSSLVAVAVSVTVDLAARRTRRRRGPGPRPDALDLVAGSVLRGARPLPALLDQLRETFGLTAVTLLERDRDTPAGRAADRGASAAVASRRAPRPGDGDAEVRSTTTCRSCCAASRWRPRTGGSSRRSPRRPRRAAPGAARRGGRRGQAARRGRPDAHRAARGGQPRPADAARLGQGGRRRVCADQDVVFGEDDRDELLATADESLDRLDPAGREPARHEPPAGRRPRRRHRSR